MKFTFYLIGKLKERYLKEAANDYLNRISNFAKTELVFIDEVVYQKEPSKATIDRGLTSEALRVLSQLQDKDYLILTDLHGEQLTSIEFANKIETAMTGGKGNFAIVIGSSFGLGEPLLTRANLRLSLSKLTTTHPLALIFMLEQVYRANMILQNSSYHK